MIVYTFDNNGNIIGTSTGGSGGAAPRGSTGRNTAGGGSNSNSNINNSNSGIPLTGMAGGIGGLGVTSSSDDIVGYALPGSSGNSGSSSSASNNVFNPNVKVLLPGLDGPPVVCQPVWNSMFDSTANKEKVMMINMWHN